MSPALQQIEQRRFLTEWHIPVSPKLSTRDLILLASSCRSVGCHIVVFSYRAAVGRLLPEIPTQSDLRKIVSASGLVKVLLRLDIEDIGEVEGRTAEEEESIVKGLATFLTKASVQFDVFSILLSQDQLLFEKLNIREIFSPFLIKCPLIINIDDCSSAQLSLPRKRVPDNSVIEFSQCRLVDSKNNINVKSLQILRQQLPSLKRYRVLVSCGGQQITPNDVEDAVVSKIRSQVDSACLTESLCGRSDFLMTNKRLGLRIVLRMKANDAKKQEVRVAKATSQCGKKLKAVNKNTKKTKKNKKSIKAETSTQQNLNNKPQVGKKKMNNEARKEKKKSSSNQITVLKESSKDLEKKTIALNSNTLAKLLNDQLLSQQEKNKRKLQSRMAKKRNIEAMRMKKETVPSKKQSGKRRAREDENADESSTAGPEKVMTTNVEEQNFGWSEDL